MYTQMGADDCEQISEYLRRLNEATARTGVRISFHTPMPIELEGEGWTGLEVSWSSESNQYVLRRSLD